jgi:hypothetical protein
LLFGSSMFYVERVLEINYSKLLLTGNRIGECSPSALFILEFVR